MDVEEPAAVAADAAVSEPAGDISGAEDGAGEADAAAKGSDSDSDDDFEVFVPQKG